MIDSGAKCSQEPNERYVSLSAAMWEAVLPLSRLVHVVEVIAELLNKMPSPAVKNEPCVPRHLLGVLLRRAHLPGNGGALEPGAYMRILGSYDIINEVTPSWCAWLTSALCSLTRKRRISSLLKAAALHRERAPTAMPPSANKWRKRIRSPLIHIFISYCPIIFSASSSVISAWLVLLL